MNCVMSPIKAFFYPILAPDPVLFQLESIAEANHIERTCL
jgi:hypothetical protein